METLIGRARHALGARKKTLALLLVFTAVTVWAGEHRRRWIIYLHITGTTQMRSLPADPSGYILQELPLQIRASYAYHHQVYFAGVGGKVSVADDRAPAPAPRLLGDAQIEPRMIFVSSRGTIFLSGVDFLPSVPPTGAKPGKRAMSFRFGA